MKGKPLKVIAGDPAHPLAIGEIEIPCYVLENETRVFSQGGFVMALDMHVQAASKREQPVQLPNFIGQKNLKPFIPHDLPEVYKPILFRPSGGGVVAYGYRAELLPLVCEIYLTAREDGALRASQQHIATRAEILLRGLATVGVIALVDEATGYQRIREQRALATILERFIAKELQPWTRTFPYEFYNQIFRLKGWPGPDGTKRPVIIAQYTNDLVYERLAPGVLKELQQRNPILPTGRHRHRHHQWFTPDFGHPKLKEHLAAVIALMKAAPNWARFHGSLNRVFHKLNETIPLPFDDEKR